LYVEGEPSQSLYVMLAGRVAVVEGYGTDGQQVVRVHGPGRFLGELSLLTGESEFFTAVALEDGEVLVVHMEGLRAVASRDLALGDDILRACFIRRTLAIGLGVGFRIIGSRYSQDTRRLRGAQPAAAPFHRLGGRPDRGELAASVEPRSAGYTRGRLAGPDAA
jgi:thioredoxin reductase (NADPH)